MINQLRAGFYVLRHTPTAALSVLVAAVAAALYTWLQHRLALGELGAASANAVQGLSDILLISLLGPLLYGVILSQPFNTRSVHSALLASGRVAFVASHTVTAASAVVALSLPYGIAVLVGRGTGAEFAPAIPTAFSSALADGGDLTGQEIAGIVALTFTAGIVTAAKLAVCLPLAIWLRRPLVVMAAGFVWSFVADLLASSTDGVSGLEAMVQLTPFAADHAPGPDSTGGEMLLAVGVSLLFLALMGLLSWLIFRRADVK